MEQLELLQFTLEKLNSLQIPYALVGAFASSIWGESRFTQDIGIVVQLDQESVAQLCHAYSADDFYLNENTASEAMRNCTQFNVIHLTSGNKIDFMVVSDSGWSASQLLRRQKVELMPGFRGYVAAPEDVILGKLIYYREGASDKHLRDIAGIFKIHGELLDRNYLDEMNKRMFSMWRTSGTSCRIPCREAILPFRVASTGLPLRTKAC